MSMEDEAEETAQAAPASADDGPEAAPVEASGAAEADPAAAAGPSAEDAETDGDAEIAAESAPEDEADDGSDDASEDVLADGDEDAPEDGAKDGADAEPEADPVLAAEAAGDASAPDAPAAQDGAFALHGRARMEETEALLAWLRAAPEEAPMTLDASAVENVSTPYILAIVGAARARAQAGRPVAVVSPSPAFVDAFSDLGLFGDLMKMEIRP